jgi:alpha-1,6-mannosyltransferase
VVLASATTLVVLCQIVGIGFGWVTALRDTGKVMSTLSITTKAGFVTSQLLGLVGIDVSSDGTVAVFRLAGLLAALAVVTVLLLRSPRIGLVRSVGLAMTALVLLGPVLWPWYLPAGFALLAAAGLGRFRPSFLVLVVAAAAFVWPTSVDPVKALQDYQHLLGFLVILGIGGAAWLAQVTSVRSRAWRVRRDDARRRLAPTPEPA